MAEQRLPIVDGDDGEWGDILNQYIAKEHYNTGADNAANGGHQAITVRPGTTDAGTAPIKLTSGPLMTTPEVGAVEFFTDAYYGTISTGTARKTFAFLESPIFTGTVTLPIIKPATDSTTAIRVNKADGTTNVLDVDTTNSRLGIGVTPAEALDVYGDVRVGTTGATSTGSIRAEKELVLRQDGDTYGSSILRMRNRSGENGAIFETTDATITLVDFIFKTSANQRNIRYEGRAASARAGAPSYHIGGASPDNPTLAIGDAYAAIANRLAIGSYTLPTAYLEVAAGTIAAGTAPLKFTSGPLMTSPEAGAIEFLADRLYFTQTTNTDRKTIAHTDDITHTPTAVWGDSIESTSVVANSVCYVRVPYTGTITSWHIIASASCSATIDVWKVNNALPAVANTITASAKPNLSSAATATSSTLTGWTTDVSAGDVFGFNLDSLTGTPTSITLTLNVG